MTLAFRGNVRGRLLVIAPECKIISTCLNGEGGNGHSELMVDEHGVLSATLQVVNTGTCMGHIQRFMRIRKSTWQAAQVITAQLWNTR